MKKTSLSILVVLAVICFGSCNSTPKEVGTDKTEELIESEEMDTNEEIEYYGDPDSEQELDESEEV